MRFRAVALLSVVLFSTTLCFAVPVITLNYTAFRQDQETAVLGTIFIPPDTNGAVGPNNVMVSTNEVLSYFDKSGNQIGGFQSQASFWSAAGVAGTPAGDMRVVFDPGSGRWFASAFTSGTGNSMLVARSDTSDPTGTWHGASFVMNGNRFADFPTLGVDANGVYIGTNNFSGNTATGVSLVSIPKSDLLLASPTVANRTLLLNDNNTGSFGSSLQGVYDASGGGAPGLVLAAQNGGNLELTQINNPGGVASLGSTTTIVPGTALVSPVLATQPGLASSLETSDNRFSGEVERVGNKIYGVNVTNIGGHDAIEWYVTDTSGTILSNGTLADSSHDYYYPTIAANANGDVVINYNRSGATENITDYAVVGSTVGNTVTFGTPLLVQQSTINNYDQTFSGTRNRWGDYSATWVDPSDPTSFWVVAEWAQFFDWTTQGFSGLHPNEWMIQVARINVGAVPEPATFGLVALAGLALAWKRLRKRA